MTNHPPAAPRPEFSVSRETEEQLRQYAEEIKIWNPKINLVSPSTIPDLYSRHIQDSLQMAPLIPASTKTVADIGSGGGLPVIPLAIALPQISFFAIESDQRKCAFLLHIKALIGLKNFSVKNMRAEKIEDLKADIVTARACANINKLIAYSRLLRHKESRCLFLKGQKYQSEIDEALREWSFSYHLHPSQTEAGAAIVEITNLQEK